jgi:hypothetical protein
MCDQMEPADAKHLRKQLRVLDTILSDRSGAE